MKSIKNLLLTVGLIKIWCGLAVSLYAQEINYAPVNIPDHYTKSIDIIYKQVDSWQGRLDLYYPMDTTVLHPLVINIHGGGWSHGVKESQRGFVSFFKNNFVVANVEYRLENQTKAPAAIEDVRCALIYLLNQVQYYGIDSDKIVLMGGSAGGHLALMAGLLNNNRLFDVDCSYDKEIQILAIIDKYGVTDLEPVRQWGSAKKWLGTQVNDLPFVKSVSPINYVNSGSPAIFIAHGDADPIVPYDQSVQLRQRLQSVGVKSEFITVKGGLHGKFPKEEKSKINKKLWVFLETLGAI
ncbi:Acetyl esterase/lipase [Reichenbachiella faecimaris]|uniref:Acetyl esterase/lipase n=1 Tax=Reichenbachiella faecimaris TaxID=692418 RepID=A0A1W2G725_REIFA|nr:alpha/beta hydrolase [Reichenbachiella faecimaris]SMD32467.1 Acetyl esterase/lipase [Reichenbachiella faecimaris]